MTTWNIKSPLATSSSWVKAWALAASSVWEKSKPLESDYGELTTNYSPFLSLATNNGDTILFHTGIFVEIPSVWEKRI